MNVDEKLRASIKCIKSSGISTAIISKKTKEIDPYGKGVGQSTIEHWILGLSLPTYHRILLVNEAINIILKERTDGASMQLE